MREVLRSGGCRPKCTHVPGQLAQAGGVQARQGTKEEKAGQVAGGQAGHQALPPPRGSGVLVQRQR